MNRMNFDPQNGFADTVAFPDPANEEEVREQLMRPSKQLQEFLNQYLVPLLTGAGGAGEIGTSAGKSVQVELNETVRYGTQDVRFIRVNADRVLETSADGQVWQATGSSGHIILDKFGNALAQRGRMQFDNCEVSDDGTKTIVHGVKGDKGDKGDTGNTGPQGVQGDKGDRGSAIVPQVDINGIMSFREQDTVELPQAVNVRGPQGPAGVQGAQGVPGAAGPQGIQGPTGLQGPKGTTGEKGDHGERGLQGPQGPQGIQGKQGEPGVTGAVGPAGPQGLQGSQGAQGAQGIQGEPGPQGPVGPAGAQGVQGQIGPKGDTGEPGPQGIVGPAGAQGIQGPMGPQGLKGDDGADGRSFTIRAIYPTLAALQIAHPTGTGGDAYAIGTAENNVIYIWDTDTAAWTLIGELRGPQGPQGIQGIQGPQGDTGPAGPAGAQGPKGDTGDTGPAGAQGEKGGQGEPGPQGPAGPVGPAGPEGSEGPQGPAGATGETGAQGPQGIQGPQGLQGPAGNTGAKGEQGETGPEGPVGPQGPRGVQGEQGVQGPAGANGKSAYQTAVEAGFAGTETAFNTAMASTPGHLDSRENPHGVTKAQVGLPNVENQTPDQIRRGGGKHLAGQGTANGYSFTGDSGEDTGMFSDSDGELYFLKNGQRFSSQDFFTPDGSKSVNYANSAGNANRLIGAGWNWSGQGGQPSWLWGGNDGQNMYVYNPANFSVNHANTAGNANTVGGHDVVSALIAGMGIHYGTYTGNGSLNRRISLAYDLSAVLILTDSIHGFAARIGGTDNHNIFLTHADADKRNFIVSENFNESNIYYYYIAISSYFSENMK
ncbi:hypothetical protein RWV98_05625 [Agathobaculum sp. NTUH-O15-33]|uniref:hypothetical protein n=1 Tax=Agathobaculum sp. NTUH-O15-33 TaxID=3079302 RepID=UPI002958C2AD|nr:hypothetical protein [Agathobaculum sp. NTUH-O15-33]WNX85747.1 hypothetical protein RWV98_05625 [Agathobaculum sp. NTUH-O15-33]